MNWERNGHFGECLSGLGLWEVVVTIFMWDSENNGVPRVLLGDEFDLLSAS